MYMSIPALVGYDSYLYITFLENLEPLCSCFFQAAKKGLVDKY